MMTEEAIIKITARFNEERTHRYLLKRQWSEKHTKSATILMSNASNLLDITQGDLTGIIIQNNLAALQYSSVNIVNLFSFMTQKLDLSGNLDKLTNEENTEQILQSAKETDVFIVAVGTLAKTYKKVEVYQHKLFERLREQRLQSKIHTIAALDGTQGLHPISAKLREADSWRIVPFTLPELPKESAPDAPQQVQTKEKKQKK